MILKQCKYVITQDPKRKMLADVDVRIEGERIVEIGYKLKGDETLPCNDKIVMPAFANCHVHSDIPFIDMPEEEFANRYPFSLIELEERLRKETSLLSTEILMEESLMRGCTLLVLFTKHYQEAQEIAKKVGIRIVTGPLISSIEDLEKVSNQKNAKTYCMYFTKLLEESTFNELSELLQDRGNKRIYVHISEDRKAVFRIKRKYGKFPVELLDRIGLLNGNTVLVHASWITNWEIEMMSNKGSSVVYCPSAEMKLGTGGFPPLRDFINRGIPVGLGTDSLLTGLSFDIIEEARLALLHQRESYKGLVVSPKDVLNLITTNVEELTNFKIGKIKEGYLADLILIKLKPKFYASLKESLILRVFYQLEYTDIESVITRGKLIQINKQRSNIRESINHKLVNLFESVL